MAKATKKPLLINILGEMLSKWGERTPGLFIGSVTSSDRKARSHYLNSEGGYKVRCTS
jgi:hypothetical protein